MKKTIISLCLALFALNIFAQVRYEAIYETPQTFTLSSITSDINLSKGAAKVAVPILVPKEAVGWYYSVTILPKKGKRLCCNALMKQLNAIKDKVDIADAANYVHPKRTGRHANVYIFDGKDNAESFVRFRGVVYHKQFIEAKSFSGYMPNTGVQNMFIGIENPYNMKGLRVKVEAVAVFKDKK